jgi:hypothetical protein
MRILNYTKTLKEEKTKKQISPRIKAYFYFIKMPIFE